MVRDDRHTMINAALMASRFFGGQKLGGIKRLTEHGCRCCGVLENTGFHLAYLAFMRAKHGMNPPDDSLLVLTPDQPLDERIDRLNDFRPELFFGTPSLLESYAPIQQDGKLQISPLAICTSDEHLVEKTLRSLENTFGCPVMNGYCIPEAGEVAMLCRENRLHVNDDWFIIEPVDAANRPVKDGKLSNGVLVTNLANLAQPLIRFRLPDRVTLHRESCACGSAFPFLGRFER